MGRLVQIFGRGGQSPEGRRIPVSKLHKGVYRVVTVDGKKGNFAGYFTQERLEETLKTCYIGCEVFVREHILEGERAV